MMIALISSMKSATVINRPSRLTILWELKKEFVLFLLLINDLYLIYHLIQISTLYLLYLSYYSQVCELGTD